MADAATEVIDLARELVSLDSRSFVSNLPVADRVEAALHPPDGQGTDRQSAERERSHRTGSKRA